MFWGLGWAFFEQLNLSLATYIKKRQGKMILGGGFLNNVFNMKHLPTERQVEIVNTWAIHIFISLDSYFLSRDKPSVGHLAKTHTTLSRLSEGKVVLKLWTESTRYVFYSKCAILFPPISY